MPELPEVETTCRGIEPHVKGAKVAEVIIRQPQLRWLIPAQLVTDLPSLVLLDVKRRSKYILLNFTTGDLIIHLGMSGSLRVLLQHQPVQKHDHFDIVFTSGCTLRLTDPRRFGAVLWQAGQQLHPLLAKLGPEPLTTDFSVDTLVLAAKNRRISIKQFIMDNKVVVGVGNIYAAEALFAAAIHPETPVNQLSKAKFIKLVSAIKYILGVAIERGGTTLKDFVGGDGKPGYFAQELQVYGRKGQSCNLCQKLLTEIKQGQRSTVFCASCQRLPKVVKK
ncbi:MAG: bifunctional DNA-formamidopyrimidine glycosylase/DNA-(apurinic or apyrimidinic site) lyase [Oceanospirillaceae bacterium]